MIPHLLPIAGAVGLGSLGYWLYKRHQAAAYVPPPMATPSAPAPSYGPPVPAQPSNVDPGFVPGPDPLAPPGGYTPGGYNPYIPTMPDYQPPDMPSAPIDYQPPDPQAVDPGTDWIGPTSPLASLNPLGDLFSGLRDSERTFHMIRQRRMLRRRGL